MTKQEIMDAVKNLSKQERHEIIDYIFKTEADEKPRINLEIGQLAAWENPSYPMHSKNQWIVGFATKKEVNSTSAIMGQYLSEYGCIRSIRMDNVQHVTPLDLSINFDRLIELTKFAEEQPKVFAERVRQKRKSMGWNNGEEI